MIHEFNNELCSNKHSKENKLNYPGIKVGELLIKSNAILIVFLMASALITSKIEAEENR